MKRRAEKIEKIIRLSSLNFTVIVEGVKDEKVLRLFGFKRIVRISGRRLEKVVESVKTKEVAVLTDFDKEGWNLRKNLIKILQRRGLKINYLLPKLVRSLGITKIEELKAFLEDLQLSKAI
jgi:5S rRNA maturation endonuclease (ribonuclease M5)